MHNSDEIRNYLDKEGIIPRNRFEIMKILNDFFKIQFLQLLLTISQLCLYLILKLYFG